MRKIQDLRNGRKKVKARARRKVRGKEKVQRKARRKVPEIGRNGDKSRSPRGRTRRRATSTKRPMSQRSGLRTS